MPNHETLDVAGRLIETGDVVTYVIPNSPRLRLGVVVRPTPKGATIRPFSPRSTSPRDQQVTRGADQVCIVSKEYQRMQFSLVSSLFGSDK